MYYFAYGSNMNHRQMNERCPTAKFITRAKLNGYKFVYDGYTSSRNGAVANIIKSDNNIVEGGLFEIDNDCLHALDKYEGYPSYYERQIVEVEDDNDNSYQAIVYLRKPQKLGKPSDEYRDIVLKGARDCGLTEEYIRRYIKGFEKD